MSTPTVYSFKSPPESHFSPESFPPPGTYSSYCWLSPRISFSLEDDSSSKHHHHKQQLRPSKPAPAISPPPPPLVAEIPPSPKQQQDLLPDFEFRLDDRGTMLPAASSSPTGSWCRCRSRVPPQPDQYLFSPKAPRCSSRWKEILGLRKFYQNNSSKAASFPSSSSASPSSSSSSSNNNQKSLRHFLHRSSKSYNSCGNSSSNSSLDGTLSLPLLKSDLDCDSPVFLSSSRLSLSSSSVYIQPVAESESIRPQP